MTTSVEMEYHINGEKPEIIGKECEGLCLIQYQEGNVITDPANTAYLKFESEWYKLYFDGGTIFWRRDVPSEPVNADVDSCLVLLNLGDFDGVIGNILTSVEYSGCGETLTAIFSFSSGKELRFTHRCDEDFTTIS